MTDHRKVNSDFGREITQNMSSKVSLFKRIIKETILCLIKEAIFYQNDSYLKNYKSEKHNHETHIVE